MPNAIDTLRKGLGNDYDIKYEQAAVRLEALLEAADMAYDRSVPIATRLKTLAAAVRRVKDESGT